ncbi:MAG: UDP-N-acetylmuramate--L-alanine ligase [Weeksellaceae bacterium]
MLLQAKHIFFVGIKGVAMANLARIFIQKGILVSGSDTTEEFITDTGLTDVTILDLDADLPGDIDLVVYSAAHGGAKSKQVREAQQKNITVMHQASLLAELIKDFKTSVAVAGCHGKTTTSALLSYTLKNLGLEPGYMVGVSDFSDLPGGNYGSKDYFVIEADEYALDPPTDKTPKFHLLHPTDAIITNIDFDHPDVYKDIDETKSAFMTFMNQVKDTMILCIDDENIEELIPNFPKSKYLTYGLDSRADARIEHIQTTEEQTTFNLIYKLNKYSFNINLFGEKNILNAAAVIAFLISKGFEPDAINTAMKGFTGAKRRFEQVAYTNDTYLFDDYAHHPHEIEATIQAAKARFPSRRLVVLFQPHTFSRTESLKEQFVTALVQADIAFIAPIFASAREQQTGTEITAEKLALIAHEKNATNIMGYNTKKQMMETLKNTIHKGDIIFTMGAGDIYHLADTITDIVKAL